MKKLLFFVPTLAMALNIYVGQPFSEYSVAKQKYVNGQNIKVVTGQHFTYYIKTENGTVQEVTALSPRMLAPVSNFIQDSSSCSKKLLFRDPLRMARYEYDCPSGKYIYQTFGVPGHLETTVWMK